MSVRILALVAAFGPPIFGLKLGWNYSSSPFLLPGIFVLLGILAGVCVLMLRRTMPARAEDLREVLIRFIIGCAWAIPASLVGYAFSSNPWW